NPRSAANTRRNCILLDCGRPSIVVARSNDPLGAHLVRWTCYPGVIVGWVYWLEPDVTDLTKLIPEAPIGLLILGGARFALVNAAPEEWVVVTVARASTTLSSRFCASCERCDKRPAHLLHET